MELLTQMKKVILNKPPEIHLETRENDAAEAAWESSCF